MLFRSDVVRGVRLFLMLFAAALIAYLAYEVWHPAVEAQVGSAEETPAPQPSATPPVEPHPLTVPPPPPVGASDHAPKVVRATAAHDVPDPPPPGPAVRPARPTPSGRDFEAPALGSAPAASPQVAIIEESPAPAKDGIGYKSLLEADPNKPAAEVPPSPAAPEPARSEGKGFFHAIGRFFKGKKDTTQP